MSKAVTGIVVDVKSGALKTHLIKRAAHHAKRAKFYADAAKNFQAEGVKQVPMQSYSNSTRIGAHADNFEASEGSHRQQENRFKVLSTNLIKGVTYRLNEHDLRSLEFYD